MLPPCRCGGAAVLNVVPNTDGKFGAGIAWLILYDLIEPQTKIADRVAVISQRLKDKPYDQ